MRETSELVTAESSMISFPTDGLLERKDRHDGTVQVLKPRVGNSGIVGLEQDAGRRFCTHDVQVINLEEVG
jgi:hypothetical protein